MFRRAVSRWQQRVLQLRAPNKRDRARLAILRNAVTFSCAGLLAGSYWDYTRRRAQAGRWDEGTPGAIAAYGLLAVALVAAGSTGLVHAGSRLAIGRVSRRKAFLLGSFVHADAAHLVANLAWLSLVWEDACAELGEAAAMACLLGASASAIGVSRATMPRPFPVGLSGGVLGLTSALLVGKTYGPLIHPFGAVGLVLTSFVLAVLKRRNPAVDHLAHFVGSTAGALYGLAIVDARQAKS